MKKHWVLLVLLALFIPFVQGWGPFNPLVSGQAPMRYDRQVVVLMYHNVGYQHRRRGTLTPGLFRAQISQLITAGYHPISEGMFLKFVAGEGNVPENAVLLTFDDGDEGFYQYAYPILREYRVPAVNFVIVSFTGNTPMVAGGQHLPHLTWAQIEQMDRGGLVQIDSHTYGLHHFVQTGPDRRAPALAARIYNPVTGRLESDAAYRERVGQDLLKARLILEQRLHRPVLSLAFPYGAYTPEALQLSLEAGYRYFYTTTAGVNVPRTGPVLVRRISAGDPFMTPDHLTRRIIRTVSGGVF